MAAYSDWPGRGGGGHWLPAYGFPQHHTHQNHGFIEDDDDEESIVVAESACFTDPLPDSATSHGMTNLGNAVGGGSGNFLFLLETIVEETSDQLKGDASPLRPGSSASSNDSGKKDIPPNSQYPFDNDYAYDFDLEDSWRCGSRGSEGDAEVPKKRRRKDAVPFFQDGESQEMRERGAADGADDSGGEDEPEDGSISRSSSLIQFESLERQLENEVLLFRATASADPFGPPSPSYFPPAHPSSSSSSSSSSSVDNEDSSSDTLTGEPPFSPSTDANSSSSSSSLVPSSSSSSSASSSSSSSSSSLLLRNQTTRLRSYRSFDSLNLVTGGGPEDGGDDGFAAWRVESGGSGGLGAQPFKVSDRQRTSAKCLAAFREEVEDPEDPDERRPDYGFRDSDPFASEGRLRIASNGFCVPEGEEDGEDCFLVETKGLEEKLGDRTSPSGESEGAPPICDAMNFLYEVTAPINDSFPFPDKNDEDAPPSKPADVGVAIDGREVEEISSKRSFFTTSSERSDSDAIGRTTTDAFDDVGRATAVKEETTEGRRERDAGVSEEEEGCVTEKYSEGVRESRGAGGTTREAFAVVREATESGANPATIIPESDGGISQFPEDDVTKGKHPEDPEPDSPPESESEEDGRSVDHGRRRLPARGRGTGGGAKVGATEGSEKGRESDGEEAEGAGGAEVVREKGAACRSRPEEGAEEPAEESATTPGSALREPPSGREGEASGEKSLRECPHGGGFRESGVSEGRKEANSSRVSEARLRLPAEGSGEKEGEENGFTQAVPAPCRTESRFVENGRDGEGGETGSGSGLTEEVIVSAKRGSAEGGRSSPPGGSSIGEFVLPTRSSSAENIYSPPASESPREGKEKSSSVVVPSAEKRRSTELRNLSFPEIERVPRRSSSTVVSYPTRKGKGRSDPEDSPGEGRPPAEYSPRGTSLRGERRAASVADSTESRSETRASESRLWQQRGESGNGAGGEGRAHLDEVYIGRSRSEGEINEERECVEGEEGREEAEGAKEKFERSGGGSRRFKIPVDGGWRVPRILRRSKGSGSKGADAAKGADFEKSGRVSPKRAKSASSGRGGGAKMRSEGKPPLPPKAGALAFLARLSFRRRKPESAERATADTAQAHAGIDRAASAEKPPPPPALPPPVSRAAAAEGLGGGGGDERGSSRGCGGAPEARPPASSSGARSASLMDLGEDGVGRGGGVAAPNKEAPGSAVANQGSVDSRAKSMEFLLDEGNKAAVLPPENELQKVGVGSLGVGGVGAPLHLSEHQLRVQRSLQKLNVPEWYLRSAAGGAHRTHPESGASSPLSLLERRHSSGRRPGGGWPGLASKTTSLSSLQTRRSPTPTRYAVAPPPSTPSSRHLLSPGALSSGGPSPDDPGGYSSFGGSVTPRGSFSRWSTSRLHQRTALSLAPSAPTSPRSSFSASRTPYLGWRSQERLLLSDASPHYRTPSERLAADLLASRRAAAAAAAAVTPVASVSVSSDRSAMVPQDPPAVEVHPPSGKSPELSDVRSSITEVTSAIVHYVSERVPGEGGGGGRSPSSGRPCSPRQLCWVESSFVGSRPIDSPQTPPELGDGSRRGSSAAGGGVAAGGSRGLSSEAAESTPNGPVRDSDEEVGLVMASGAMLEAAARRAAVHLELESYGNTPNPSATLEDVLDSLLGLPPASSRSPSPASPASPSRHPHQQTRPGAVAVEHGGVTEVVLPDCPTPPPPPQLPLSIAQVPPVREVRRRNPSHQRRARNQSRAISPPSPGHQQSRAFRGTAVDALHDEAFEIREIRPSREAEGAYATAAAAPTPPPAVEEQAASPSEEEEEEEAEEEGSAEQQPPPPAPHEEEDEDSIKTTTAPRPDKLRPREEDAPTRRRVSFETRQPSDDSEADARRRRHANRKRSRAAALCRRAAAAATAPNSPALPVLSRVARQGFLSRGRGCVKIFFSGPERAEAFTGAAVRASLAGVRSPSDGEATTTALAEIGEPAYAGWADLPLPSGGCGERCYRDLVQLCRTYDPDSKLVLLVCVCVSSAETPGAEKWSRKVVSRCTSAKLGRFRLAPEPEYHLPRRRPTDPPPPPPRRRRAPGREGVDPRPGSPITREMEYPETLVLRELPSAGSTSGKRETAYGNVRKHLKRRGVSLRKQFPEVHRRLRSYVEEGTTFAPAAIHPRDGLTGRPFLCVILPEGAEEPCWDAEEGGGRLKTVDLGAADEDDDENVLPRRNSDDASDPGGGS